MVELEAVSLSETLDFSSIQHIASWISAALLQIPSIHTHLASDAQQQLIPLSTSLVLSTGKEMSKIWRACLPFRPASSVIAEGYERLMTRADNSAGEVWDSGML